MLSGSLIFRFQQPARTRAGLVCILGPENYRSTIAVKHDEKRRVSHVPKGNSSRIEFIWSVLGASGDINDAALKFWGLLAVFE
jgi:hypothetical protein